MYQLENLLCCTISVELRFLRNSEDNGELLLVQVYVAFCVFRDLISRVLAKPRQIGISEKIVLRNSAHNACQTQR